MKDFYLCIESNKKVSCVDLRAFISLSVLDHAGAFNGIGTMGGRHYSYRFVNGRSIGGGYYDSEGAVVVGADDFMKCWNPITGELILPFSLKSLDRRRLVL